MNINRNKIGLILLIICIIIVLLTIIIVLRNKNYSKKENIILESSEINIMKNENNMNKDANIEVIINNKTYKTSLENNDTVDEFKKILPQEFEMKELNGNEKYTNLDNTFPTKTYYPGHIEAGDIMLFGDNCLVVFYKSFDTTFGYTKIGHIQNIEDLGKNDIVIKFNVVE